MVRDDAAPDEHLGADGTAQRNDAGRRRDEAADERDHSAVQRDDAAALRDEAGNDRDDVAETRDHAGQRRDLGARHRDTQASHRDAAAEQRDRLADGRDRDAVANETRSGRGLRALAAATLARQDAASDRGHSARDRAAGAAERGQAGDDRVTAFADRGSGAMQRADAEADRSSAHDDRDANAAQRVQAAGDRGTSSADRDGSTSDLAAAQLDGLTGVFTRGAGLFALQREIQRSHRTGEPLALSFIDVDGLKAINDSGGHAAGDRTLVEVARALTANLRPYDLVIRYGGDEFLCAFAGATTDDVAERAETTNAVLAAGPASTTVTAGLAGLRTGDTLESLIGRADDDLYRQRRLR